MDLKTTCLYICLPFNEGLVNYILFAGRMLHAKYEGESLLPWYSRANLPEKFYFVIPDARTV